MVPVEKEKDLPTLEEVQELFAAWRNQKGRRDPIPPALWESAIYLVAQYSINAIAKRQSGHPFRRQTYCTLFGLLSRTGLRVSEAIRLRFEDITPDGMLIRNSKFRKSRLVPLHKTARAGLERYLEYRLSYAPPIITCSCRCEEHHCLFVMLNKHLA